MTEQEKLRYKILGQISNMNVPIVFKGGLITKLILEEQGFTNVQRTTKDIDANWIGTPPSMSIMVNTINRSLGDLQNYYVAEISREYGVHKSAGIAIKEKDSGDRIITMDIDIKPLIGSKVYYLGETSINGVLPNEILADKICAISGDAVYKHRTKDIIDVYSLSHCTEVSTKEIYEICNKANREIQSFDAFFHRKSDVEHAYDKLREIEGKPPFLDVYDYLSTFIKPFAEKDFSDKVWNLEKSSWRDVPNVTKDERAQFPLSRDIIKKNAETIAKKHQQGKNPNKNKKPNEIE